MSAKLAIDRPTEELVAANAFRDKLVPRADSHNGNAPLWRGWAIFDAFLAGLDWARDKRGNFTADKRRAVRRTDKNLKEWEVPGCGFVLAADGETVIGRFPRFEDAVLDAAAPDLLEMLQDVVEAEGLVDPAKRSPWFGKAYALVVRFKGAE